MAGKPTKKRAYTSPAVSVRDNGSKWNRSRMQVDIYFGNNQSLTSIV